MFLKFTAAVFLAMFHVEVPVTDCRLFYRSMTYVHFHWSLSPTRRISAGSESHMSNTILIADYCFKIAYEQFHEFILGTLPMATHNTAL